MGVFPVLETQKTPSLQWSYQGAFSIYFVFFVALPARLLAGIVLLLSPRWREAV